MNILKSFSVLLTLVLLISSCQKEQVLPQDIEAPLFEQVDFQTSLDIVNNSIDNDIEDANVVYKKMYDERDNNLDFIAPSELSDLINTSNEMSRAAKSFSNLANQFSDKIDVSDAEADVLKEFDKFIFEATSINEAMNNMGELDKLIQVSTTLSDVEKQNLREVNALLYHGFKYQQENSFLRTEWIGCMAGIFVTIGGGASANPLAIIAGGMIIGKYC